MKRILIFLSATLLWACPEQEPEIENMKAQPFTVAAPLAENGKDVQLTQSMPVQANQVIIVKLYNLKYA